MGCDANRLMKRQSPFKFTAPAIRRHGWPNAYSEFVVPTVARQTRHWRVPTTFVALMACGFRREVATACTSNLHGWYLSGRES